MKARAFLLGVVFFAFFVLGAPPAHPARERTGNLDVFLVLDESGSMKPIFSRVTTFIADALVRDYLEPEDYLCIIGFSNEARIRVSQRLFSEAEKENLTALVKTLNVVPEGFTDMGRSLEEALKQLERLSHPSHQQVVLILTDGVNHPPRDSPYFSPVKRDTGKGLPPTSDFNAEFLARVKTLSEKGFRTHVVGIGKVTDAKKLGEALGSDYTLLQEFDSDELSKGLAAFWDDTINLVALEIPEKESLPGEELSLSARLESTSDQEREVQIQSVAVRGLEVTAAAVTPRWTLLPREEKEFEVRVRLPPEFPAGDYEATLLFEQASAVKFYPPEASFAFHVPSFWERHGLAVGASGLGFLFVALMLVLYRRRPIPITMVVDGEAQAMRPVPLRITGHSTMGGGASDRFRIVGLPQKVAVFERRSVSSFALISSKSDLVPTIPQYELGEPIEVRTAEGGNERKVVRFIRFQKKPTPVRAKPISTTPKPKVEGGVDFR